jgi:hypothetical protein
MDKDTATFKAAGDLSQTIKAMKSLSVHFLKQLQGDIPSMTFSIQLMCLK